MDIDLLFKKVKLLKVLACCYKFAFQRCEELVFHLSVFDFTKLKHFNVEYAHNFIMGSIIRTLLSVIRLHPMGYLGQFKEKWRDGAATVPCVLRPKYPVLA